MQAKTLLKSFWQLVNVLRVAGVQFLSVFSLSFAIGHWAAGAGVRGCPAFAGSSGLFFWIALALGAVSTTIAIFYILFPAIWMQSVDRQLVFGSVDAHLPFFSTQPIYVFLDVVLLIPAIALFQAGRIEAMCQFNFDWAFGAAFLAVAVFYPILRTISWFVLKRRIEVKKIEIPWPTLIMWWILVVPLVSFVTYNYLDSQVFPRVRVPVVNEKTFKGGLEKNPKFMAGIVRVQGILVRDIAKCGLFGKDPLKYPYPAGTILLDLGKRNGQIMVKANSPSLVKMLEVEAGGRKGKLFEAFGRLSKLPNPTKKLVCGIGKASTKQKGGLALLEIEMPQK
jgi:hypothetical protein